MNKAVQSLADIMHDGLVKCFEDSFDNKPLTPAQEAHAKHHLHMMLVNHCSMKEIANFCKAWSDEDLC